jgi:hypothetical protein
MMMDLSYAASSGRVSRGDLADARHRLSVALKIDDPEAFAQFDGYLDRIEAAAGDPDTLADLGLSLRRALHTWHRPDPVDASRRDIHG